MKKLGLSVYPEKATLEEWKKYLDLGNKYGFKRLFTCLLSVEGDKEKIVNNFKEIIDYANNLDYEVIVDISPRIFNELNISYNDLDFFGKLNVYGIRLDLGYSGNEESLMTFNEYNLKIELNISNDTHYIDTIMDYMPNKENLLGSYNFYPHKYTGLSREHFRKCFNRFERYNIEKSAFINSKNATFGPWPVDDGLCTLEEHRNFDVLTQAKDLFNEGIDNVIISNCFASEEELKLLSHISKNILEFSVELVDGVPEIEKKIILEELHFSRGDINENMIRSTQSRVKYKGYNFKIFNAKKTIIKGDILIESSEYGHYAGELQIALFNMENSGKTNVVGRIKENELFLLDKLRPWQKFKLVLDKN